MDQTITKVDKGPKLHKMQKASVERTTELGYLNDKMKQTISKIEEGDVVNEIEELSSDESNRIGYRNQNNEWIMPSSKVPSHPKNCPLCKSEVKIYRISEYDEAIFMCSNLKSCVWPLDTHGVQDIYGMYDPSRKTSQDTKSKKNNKKVSMKKVKHEKMARKYEQVHSYETDSHTATDCNIDSAVDNEINKSYLTDINDIVVLNTPTTENESNSSIHETSQNQSFTSKITDCFSPMKEIAVKSIDPADLKDKTLRKVDVKEVEAMFRTPEAVPKAHTQNLFNTVNPTKNKPNDKLHGRKKKNISSEACKINELSCSLDTNKPKKIPSKIEPYIKNPYVKEVNHFRRKKSSTDSSRMKLQIDKMLAAFEINSTKTQENEKKSPKIVDPAASQSQMITQTSSSAGAEHQPNFENVWERKKLETKKLERIAKFHRAQYKRKERIRRILGKKDAKKVRQNIVADSDDSVIYQGIGITEDIKVQSVQNAAKMFTGALKGKLQNSSNSSGVKKVLKPTSDGNYEIVTHRRKENSKVVRSKVAKKDEDYVNAENQNEDVAYKIDPITKMERDLMESLMKFGQEAVENNKAMGPDMFHTSQIKKERISHPGPSRFRDFNNDTIDLESIFDI